jgi:hypothetical protein
MPPVSVSSIKPLDLGSVVEATSMSISSSNDALSLLALNHLLLAQIQYVQNRQETSTRQVHKGFQKQGIQSSSFQANIAHSSGPESQDYMQVLPSIKSSSKPQEILVKLSFIQ